MPKRGLLLDIDGTLLDSNGAHAAAYVDALAGEGIDVPVERVQILIGMGGEKLLARIGVDPRSGVAQRVVRSKREIFADRYLPALRPTRGARDLLDHARARGLLLVVATSASAEELSALLSAARASPTSSMRRARRAARQALESRIRTSSRPPVTRSKLGRHELAMLGDTPYDVEAAVRARVPILGVRCGGWTDADLAGAEAVYDDPTDLWPATKDSLLT